MPHNHNATLDALISLRGSLATKAPDPTAIPEFVETVLAILFPQHSHGSALNREALNTMIDKISNALTRLCQPVVPNETELTAFVSSFIEELPHFHSLLLEDAKAIFKGDPAATSIDEVILAYPGLLAIAVYRIAHWIFLRNIPVVPRMISEQAHRLTGIDIHPGATIGRSFVIDHGTGIVIGETTIIHDNVKMYQGVTLGALSVDKAMANTKRHPTIEEDVVIYANATILGGDTVIGAGSVVGGNVWLTESLAPGSRVYHKR